MTDKTEQEKLQASEVRYRRLFETAKDGIFLLDADTGRITDVNPFLEDMLGYSHNELIGKALWEIGAVKDITASQEAMNQLQIKEYVRYENLPLETKAGQQIQVEFVSNVYFVDGWRVIQCNIRDITARKRAEDGIRAANDELMASMAELQRRDEEMKSLIRLNELLQSCTRLVETHQVVAPTWAASYSRGKVVAWPFCMTRTSIWRRSRVGAMRQHSSPVFHSTIVGRYGAVNCMKLAIPGWICCAITLSMKHRQAICACL